MKKLTPRKVNNLYTIILVVSAIIALVGGFTETTVVIVIGIILTLANVVARVILYRCPHCGTYLDRSTGDFCPHCGEKVNE